MRDPAGSDITRDDIAAVVSAFYAQARVDPMLGPIFMSHVADWAIHEEKITQFWRGAILRDRGYTGNPMQKHLQANDVKADHFPIWLDLFDTVLQEHLSPTKAREWSNLAHRIGQSLSFGLEYAHQANTATPPNLSNLKTGNQRP